MTLSHKRRAVRLFMSGMGMRLIAVRLSVANLYAPAIRREEIEATIRAYMMGRFRLTPKR